MSFFTPFAFVKQAVVAGGLDPDAQAFLTATGITDPTIEGAINTLVLDLKSYGIWDEMEVIYPFVGGTATTNKYNLKDPQDTDGAYRINFVNSWTHDATGSRATTSTSYGNTYFNPTVFSNVATGMSFGYYSITTGSPSYNDSYDFGAYTGNNNFISIDESTDGIVAKYAANNSNFTILFSSLSGNRQGFRQVSGDTTSTANFDVSNSSGEANDTGTVAGAYPNLNLYLGALNLNGSPYSRNTKNYLAYAYMGNPLTTQERADYFTAVQAFQTTLGRQR